MLFSDSIKDHWLNRIDELGDRFDPDCGCKPPLWELGDAAPLNLLTGLYDKDSLWTSYEKEFQLPRWILELVDTHMHEASPRTSYEDLRSVIEACPTYTDMDLLYHKFSQKILMYLISNFSDVPAQLDPDAFFGCVWTNLLINEKRAGNRLPSSVSTWSKGEEALCAFEYWGEPSNPYMYFGRSSEAIQKRYTGCWVEYLHALHKIKGVNMEYSESGRILLDMLLETLKEADNEKQ